MMCRRIAMALLGFLLASMAQRAGAEEIWLTDNSRVYGLVTGLQGQSLQITLPSSEIKSTPLEEIIAVNFRGRTPRFVEVGTQEFVFQRGGTLRAQILGQSGEAISVVTSASGTLAVDTRKLSGLVGLPLEGITGRRATEMLAMDKGPHGSQLDLLLDRRGSKYPGVIERVDRASIVLDHEEVLRGIAFGWGDVAGVRLADADKVPPPPVPTDPYLRITLRDGSRFDGVLQRIRSAAWYIRPLWEEKSVIGVDVNEIVSVSVMGGKVQYLSQLPIASAYETTLIAPPHTYRLDRNCEGGAISIGGATFPWGLGVHANSELTYDLDGRFNQFLATIGLDTTAGREGTVVFRLLGDGKELYHSPAVKGGAAAVDISVTVAGVKKLVLCANAIDGNDLADAANWAVARVAR